MNIGMDELRNQQAVAVLDAATKGARQILGGRAALIQDIAAETALQWVLRIQSGSPPLDAAKWAFIVGKNRALMACKRERRSVEEPLDILLKRHIELPHDLTEESAFVDAMNSPARQVTVQQAVEEMRTAFTHKRLERLAAKIRPNGLREFTLEELCRYWWQINKRGFLAYMRKEYNGLQVFADMFERDAAAAASSMYSTPDVSTLALPLR